MLHTASSARALISHSLTNAIRPAGFTRMWRRVSAFHSTPKMSGTLQYTALDEIPEIHAKLKATFKSGVTRPLEWRKHQLRQMARLLQENKKAIEHAVWQDLRKPPVEAVISEVYGIVKVCQMGIDELDQWAAPTKPPVHPSHGAWNATIHAVPKGAVLIIAPWNYPFTLALKPLVGAISAGCCAVVKPSELSSHSAALIASLVPKYLDTTAYTVVNGAVQETTALLNLRWDHIMYTGGGVVGRVVAAAAAKNVTPITLELGGKSPVVVDTDCDIEIAAKRVLFGKSQNSGQLCVNPDYVLVPRSIYPAFLESLKQAHDSFWPEGPFHPSAQWGSIVNERHASRLIDLMKNTKGQLLIGGAIETQDGITRIAPTVYSDVSLDDALMADEIFGPILPILPVDSIDEAVEIISQRPSPLVIYAFTNNEQTKRKLLEQTSSGSLSFNDTIGILAADELPFGGQGDSGYGVWHGPYTYETFTHRKVSVDIAESEEPNLAGRYPPYTEGRYNELSKLALAPVN